jgi:hypothetical protein
VLEGNNINKRLIKFHISRIGSVPDFKLNNKVKTQTVWPDRQSHSQPIEN